MKIKQLALVFASVLALSAAQTFATEHESEHQSGGHESGKHKSGHEMKADADGDGKVSYDEYKGSREKGHERQFKKMDTNGDGYIDASEKQAQKDNMKAKRDKRKQKRKSHPETTENPS